MIWFIVIYALAALVGGMGAKLYKKVKTSSAILIGISWPLIFLIGPLFLLALLTAAIGDAWDDFFDM